MGSYKEITADQLGRIVEEAASEVFLFSADDFRFLMVNRGARDNLGFSMEDLRHLTPWDIKPEFSRDEFLELVGPLISGATDRLDFETVHERSDGSRYYVSVRLQLMQLGNKGVYYAAIQDISELRQTQEALRESTRRLDAILNNTTMAVFMMDERQHCVFMNAAAQQMTGFSLAETQGKTLHEVIHHTYPDGRHFPIEECAIDRAFPENNQTKGEEVFVHKDGSFYPVGFTASPLKDDRGATIGTIIEARNIEAELEARKTEEKLKRSQKLEAVGQLTGGIAHDFNNLVMIIQGNAELLELSKLDEDQAESLALINQACSSAADLTQRLLFFARQSHLQTGCVDLAKLIPNTVALLRAGIPEAITIQSKIPAGIWQAKADANALEQAIVNLALNSRDAMPQGGAVVIGCENRKISRNMGPDSPELEPGDYVLVSVTDNGEGMPPEVLAKVFEPFFTTKDVGKGTGLGLSTVYGFAKQSDGKVTIYSELGEGTTVNLYLPRFKETLEQETPEPAMEQVQPQTGQRILLVEDQPIVREHVEKLLTKMGYVVTTAEHGPEALSLVNLGHKFDILFTDIIMPGGMNGQQLAEEARKVDPRMKVLFTSGYPAFAFEHLGLGDIGNLRLLKKPYRSADLKAALADMLDKYGQ